MARIKEYQPQVSPVSQGNPGRRADPTDFGGGTGLARLGGALASVGSDLGLVAYRTQQAEEAREVTDVYVQFAKKESEWNQRLRDDSLTADPSDLAWSAKFNDAAAQDIEKLDKYQTPGGRAAFEKHKAMFGAHFVERAGTFQADMTGKYAVQSVEKYLNERRSVLMGDPRQFPRVAEEATAFLNDPTAITKHIPVAAREKIQRTMINELALSAVQGEIKLTPEMAKAELERGDWDKVIDADKKHALINEAKVEINGRWAENDRLRLVREREEKKAQEVTKDKFIAKAMGMDLSTPEILASNLNAADKEHYINLNLKLAKDLAEKKFTTTPSVYEEIFDRIHAKPGDPTRLTSEVAIDDALGHGLNPTDHERLRKEYRENRDDQGGKFTTVKKSFFDGIKPRIDKSNPLMGKMDPDGAHENYRFQQFVDTQIDAYRKEGKDPGVLLDPTKPEYLGRPEIVNQFQKTIQQSMATFSQQMQRDVPKPPPTPEKARKEGEGVADYIQRQWNKLFERTGNAEGSIPPAPAVEPQAPAPPKAEALDPVLEILKQDEGFRGQVYEDSTGHTTLGYGRNLDGKPLKKEEAEYLLKGDIADARREAADTFPYYGRLDPVRQDAMTMLTFNLGPRGLKGFKRFNEAMSDKNYVTAAAELMDSQWAKTVGPTRSQKIAGMIRTGKTE
jgi:lysozyme